MKIGLHLCFFNSANDKLRRRILISNVANTRDRALYFFLGNWILRGGLSVAFLANGACNVTSAGFNFTTPVL